MPYNNGGPRAPNTRGSGFWNQPSVPRLNGPCIGNQDLIDLMKAYGNNRAAIQREIDKSGKGLSGNAHGKALGMGLKARRDPKY